MKCGVLIGILLVLVDAAWCGVPLPRDMRGPFPIMSTPYFDDGSVDYKALGREAQWVDDCGCPGVIWCQSNDAVDLLTADEKFKGFEACAQAVEVRAKYMHPLWRDVNEVAQKVGGHGGMDFIMDLRWAWCLQNGEPLDMDVYDLAATSCLCELTETSDRSGSKPVSVPDFTRGNWRNVKPWGIVNVDLTKMGLDQDAVKKDSAALSV